MNRHRQPLPRIDWWIVRDTFADALTGDVSDARVLLRATRAKPVVRRSARAQQ